MDTTLDFPDSRTEPLGRSALGSVLLAKERGSLLFCDDLVLRTLAKRKWGVSGACSQAVISELARRGVISEGEYHRAIIGLLERNYFFVRIDPSSYLWLLREEKMRLTPRVLKVLSVLEGPDCTEDSAIAMIGALLRDIFMEPRLRTTRHLLVDACISSLKEGRQPDIVLSKLDAHVQRLMVMNPEGLQEIRRAIALWKNEAHLLEGRVAIGNRNDRQQARALHRSGRPGQGRS